MSGGIQFRVRVAAAAHVTPTVRHVRFERIDGEALPPYSAGSHIVLTLETAERTLRNAYSLLGSTLSGGGYEIAVLRHPQSRGGSAHVHDRLGLGSELSVSAPMNLFAIDRRARHHVLVAGGIGITPIGAMAAELAAVDASFELHYAMREEDRGAFAQELASRHGRRVRLYVGARRERLSARDILEHQPLGTHLYVCGPESMIDGVLQDASACGWPAENLHSERFLAPAGGEAFTLRLARSGIVARVGELESLLEAIEAAGVDAPYLCRGGACGQCATAVVSADGELLHNDHYLSAAERAGGAKILTCVSRLKGRELVLDL